MALNSRHVRGIEIEIGGNATALKTALDSANRSIKTTQSELDTLKNHLKIEWNADQFNRAQELAQRAVQQTAEKAELLKQALAALDSQGVSRNTEQYEAIRRELSYVQVAAQRAEEQLTAVNQLQFSQLNESIGEARETLTTTQAEVDSLRSRLQGSWSMDTFRQAQVAAGRAVAETAQYADLLRRRLEQLEGAGLQGEDVSEYQRLRRELTGAEDAARGAARQLMELQGMQLDNLRQDFSSAAESLDGLGNALSVGLTGPLAVGGAAAVNFASDTAESMNKVEVAFDDAANGVKRWSNSTLTSIGLAKGTALDMAALFGDMATSMDFGTAEAAEMSKSLVNLAADLASFKNLSIDEANTALKSIFTGETESLKNLGVVMTEANLKAYALAQGIQKSYESLTQAEKVTLRYQYVMAQTKNAQGDFARTFDGTANQLRVCQESLKELAATAGEDLLPIITPIITKVNELLGAFTEMDESTRGVVMQALLFTATLGPMLKATGAVAAGLGKGVGLYKTLNAVLSVHRARNTEAAVSQEILNLAQAASPAGMLITAIGALTAIVVSFGVTAWLTAEKTETLNDKVRESRKAYEETSAALAAQEADTLSMVAALETLVGTEHKTIAEKETLLSLVAQLNEAVPELSLAYDTQTDSINLTTAAIRDMALAQAEQDANAARVKRLSELYVEQQTLSNDLAAAEDALSAAEERKNQLWEEGAYRSAEMEGAVKAASQAYVEAQQTVEDLRAALEENGLETKNLDLLYRSLEKRTGDLAAAHGKHGKAATSSSKALHGAAEIMETMAEELTQLSAATDEQTAQTQALLKDTDLLSDAFAEQSKSGTLSLDTALKLIDAGHQSLLVVDKENGAIRLNAEAFQQLTAQKIADRLETLESQRARVNAAITLIQEGTAANAAAGGYLALGKAKITEQQAGKNSTAATLEQLQAQQATLDAQIATLTALKNNLGKITVGGSKGSSTSKSAAKSAADTMVEAYREAVEEIDFLLDMGELNEEAYYQRLEKLRDKYLKKNSDEWRSATVKLHDWQEAQEKAAAQAKEDAYNEGLADLNYFRNMELISEEEYYRRMAALRDSYLEEDSNAWRQANEALYAYKKDQMQKQLDELQEQLEAEKEAIEDWYETEADALEERYDGQKDAAKSAYDAEKKAAKDAYDAEKQAAKEAYEARKAQIKDTLALEKERLNEIIAGIDAEIQARRELREDEEQDDAIARAQKKLDAAKAQLAFARTDEDRKQWSDEIVRLEQALKDAIEAKEDTEFYREKEIEKDQVKDQITEAEKKAEQELAAAETDYTAKTAQLEANYTAKVAQLEAAYQEKLRQLEAEYQRALAELKAESERRVAEAERAFRENEQHIKDAFNKEQSTGTPSSKDGFGGNDDPNDYIVGGSAGGDKITVDDIVNAGPGGYGPDGLGFKPGYNPYAGAAKAMGSAFAAAAKAGTAAGSKSGAVTNHTRSATANVNIYQAPSLTEGQIAGTVQKLLSRLSR